MTLVAILLVLAGSNAAAEDIWKKEREKALSLVTPASLMEDVTYNAKGKPIEASLMQYKIPTRLDMGTLRVEFENSYEPSGPYGAKSIGEIVINTPSPALAHAIFRATGVWHRELPITPEKIAMSIH